LRIVYLAHDLDDPAIHRRVRMLKAGGAAVVVAGFRRGNARDGTIAGIPPVELGQTRDGDFIGRIRAVLRTRLLPDLLSGADIILARNLEMLALSARQPRGSSKLPVVYECLDIHRLMTGNGPVGKFLRFIEGRLARRAALLLTSSPAFVRDYFVERSKVALPILIIENKVLEELPAPPTGSPLRKAVPPWRIGWFGIIRCRLSLAILGALSDAHEGRIEIIIRGRPAVSVFPDFEREIARFEYVHFLGPFDGSQELAEIYNDVHFAWAIDFYEEGLNSRWLLPNRLYESCRFGAVPIAQAAVETGSYLERESIGVRLGTALEPDLHSFFETLSPATYQAYRSQVKAVPDERWVYGLEDCARLVAHLETVAKGQPVQSAML
jgi:succinoglycan biosynthesis protein ExoL